MNVRNEDTPKTLTVKITASHCGSVAPSSEYFIAVTSPFLLQSISTDLGLTIQHDLKHLEFNMQTVTESSM